MTEENFRKATKYMEFKPHQKKNLVENYGVFETFHAIFRQDPKAELNPGAEWHSYANYVKALAKAGCSKMPKEWIHSKLNPIIGGCGIPEADGAVYKFLHKEENKEIGVHFIPFTECLVKILQRGLLLQKERDMKRRMEENKQRMKNLAI